MSKKRGRSGDADDGSISGAKRRRTMDDNDGFLGDIYHLIDVYRTGFMYQEDVQRVHEVVRQSLDNATGSSYCAENGHPIIDVLPDEILGRILLLAYGPKELPCHFISSKRMSKSRLWQLASVCSRWHTLLLSMLPEQRHFHMQYLTDIARFENSFVYCNQLEQRHHLMWGDMPTIVRVLPVYDNLEKMLVSLTGFLRSNPDTRRRLSYYFKSRDLCASSLTDDFKRIEAAMTRKKLIEAIRDCNQDTPANVYIDVDFVRNVNDSRSITELIANYFSKEVVHINVYNSINPTKAYNAFQGLRLAHIASYKIPLILFYYVNEEELELSTARLEKLHKQCVERSVALSVSAFALRPCGRHPYTEQCMERLRSIFPMASFQ